MKIRKFYDPKAEGGGGNEPTQEELLNAVSERVSKDLETRGFGKDQKLTDAVRSAVEAQFKDMPLEALRAYEKDKAAMDAKIRNIASDLEKTKNSTEGSEKRTMKSALAKNMDEIEKVFAGGPAAKRSFTLDATRAAAIMTTENTIEYPEELPEDLIESFSISDFVPKRWGNQFIYEIADRSVVQEIEKYKTWLEEGDEEGAFAVVLEGALKPLVSTALVRNFSEARKVAGKYVVTEEFVKFRRAAWTIIQRIIRDKMLRDYAEIVTTEMLAASAPYAGTVLDGTIADPNDYDAIGAVASQIQTLNFYPDVLILHPQDMWRIRLTKDNEGRYIFPVTTEGGTTSIFGFRVVLSTYQTIGNFTLGESGLFKIEEEPITTRLGYGITMNGEVVESDFDHNRMRIILEMFFHAYLPTNHIGSFVTASFATVKAALATP